MSGPRFQVEFVVRPSGPVFARQLDPGSFAWPPGTRLGDHVVRGVAMPRALDSAGRPRFDLFGFELSAEAIERVQVGDVLVLTTPG